MLLHTVLSLLLTVLSGSSLDRTVSMVPVAAIKKGNTPIATVFDVSAGAGVVTALVPSVLLGTATPESLGSDQTLTTSVQDPGNEDEPWIVTTHRRSGESQSAFIKRHMEMVRAVRDALGPEVPHR